MKTWIGLDIGRDSISLSVIDKMGTQIRSQELSINSKSSEVDPPNPSELLTQIIAQIESTSSETEIPQALGLSCANQFLLLWDRNTSVPIYGPVRVTARPLRYRTQDKLTEPTNPRHHSQSETDLQQLMRTAMENGSLILGSLECWLLNQLTGSNLAFMDPSCASRFFSLDQIEQISNGAAPQDLGLNRNQLPIVSSFDNPSNLLGKIHLKGGRQLTVNSFLCQQSALLIANRCLLPGQGVLLFGQESTILINLGTEFRDSDNTFMARELPHGESVYYREIKVPDVGDTLQWLFSNFGLGNSLIELHQLARQVRTSEQVALVPYRVKTDSAKSTSASFLLAGLGVSSNRLHIARAGLESIALQVSTAVRLWNDSNPIRLESLSIANGMDEMELLFQLISDLSNLTIICSGLPRTPAYGAALSARFSHGMPMVEPNDKTNEAKSYIPSPNNRATSSKLEKWLRFQNKLTIFDQ